MKPPHAYRRTGPPVERRTDRIVERISPTNRALVASGVLARRARGLRAPSTYNWAYAMWRWDEALNGHDFRALTADLLAHGLTTLRKDPALGPASIYALATHMKTTLRDVLDTEALPRSVSKVLNVKVPKKNDRHRLITETEFLALLEYAAKDTRIRNGLPVNVLGVTLLWTLRDAGMRADEMLSLNLGDVRLQPDGRGTLSLREEAPVLGDGEHKTGVREVQVRDAVPALKAFLSLHPSAGDPHSPLFTNFEKKSDTARLRYLSLNRWLVKIGTESGVNANRRKPISAHDFRHTAATFKARAGWGDNQMRVQFGWSDGSHMPAHYAHLVASDLAKRILDDPAILPTVAPAAVAVPKDPAALLQDAVQSMIAKAMGIPPGKTTPG